MPGTTRIPHYRRIFSLLLTALRDGTILKLPSERSLARRYQIARGTARRALEELKKLGYARSIQGSGTYSCSQSPRRIACLGYLLQTPNYTRLCQRLRLRLEEAGYQLTMLETGLYGECLGSTASVRAIVRECEALLWYVPSRDRGRQEAIRIRRHLPVRMPMVLIDDPLGLALHGTHRFDLLHFDNAMAARHLVSLLASRNIHHPVLVRRSDVQLFSTEETQRGFLAGLTNQGIKDAETHFIDWSPDEPERFGAFMTKRRTWRPDAVILGYDYKSDFVQACSKSGFPFPKELPLYGFGHEPIGKLRMMRDYSILADACADLILSRLQRPNRPNTHTTVAIPVRGRI